MGRKERLKMENKENKSLKLNLSRSSSSNSLSNPERASIPLSPVLFNVVDPNKIILAFSKQHSPLSKINFEQDLADNQGNSEGNLEILNAGDPKNHSKLFAGTFFSNLIDALKGIYHLSPFFGDFDKHLNYDYIIEAGKVQELKNLIE